MCNRFTFEVLLNIHTCYPNVLTCVFLTGLLLPCLPPCSTLWLHGPCWWSFLSIGQLWLCILCLLYFSVVIIFDMAHTIHCIHMNTHTYMYTHVCTQAHTYPHTNTIIIPLHSLSNIMEFILSWFACQVELLNNYNHYSCLMTASDSEYIIAINDSLSEVDRKYIMYTTNASYYNNSKCSQTHVSAIIHVSLWAPVAIIALVVEYACICAIFIFRYKQLPVKKY